MSDLTREEANAIASLRRLASRWPSTLMLASLGGALVVIPTENHGAGPDGAIDPQSVLADIYGIPNTGGDW